MYNIYNIYKCIYTLLDIYYLYRCGFRPLAAPAVLQSVSCVLLLQWSLFKKINRVHSLEVF